MTNKNVPKFTLTEEMFSNLSSGKKLKDQLKDDPGTSYEVFRNNTTAVEVIVKEIPNRDIKKEDNKIPNDEKFKNLQEKVEMYKYELDRAKKTFQKAINSFKVVTEEMKGIIDEANRREMDMNHKIITLSIENEKLTTLLEYKSNLLNKFKKELTGMKRLLKYLLKCIIIAPKVSYNITKDSDNDYDVFESELKKEIKVKFAEFNDTTFDSNISKSTKNSFEKH